MDLIIQVKKEIEERKEKETKAKIERMLNLIGSKKEQVEKLNKEILDLEADLKEGDFSKLYINVPFPLDWRSGSTWAGGAF